MSNISFEGKVVIVTGAGSGLGREYALEFARRGASVVVNDLGVARDGSGSTKNAADAVVTEIKNSGGKAVANYDSVATPEGGINIVKTAVDTFGTVDVLVNNAGFLRDKSMMKMTADEWDAIMSVHLRGAFCVTQPALAVMREHNYGRIMVTSSTSGIFGNFGQINYGSAKMGLVGFMNVLKLEASKFNVHVNAIAPTAYSRMTENLIPKELAPKLQAKSMSPWSFISVRKNARKTAPFLRWGLAGTQKRLLYVRPAHAWETDRAIFPLKKCATTLRRFPI